MASSILFAVTTAEGAAAGGEPPEVATEIIWGPEAEAVATVPGMKTVCPFWEVAAYWTTPAVDAEAVGGEAEDPPTVIVWIDAPSEEEASADGLTIWYCWPLIVIVCTCWVATDSPESESTEVDTWNMSHDDTFDIGIQSM